jgi:hypothetical protein
MPGHDGAFLQMHMGEHHALTREEAAADGVGYSFQRDVVPRCETDL